MKNLLSHWNLDVEVESSEFKSRVELYRVVSPNLRDRDKLKLLREILRSKIGTTVDDFDIEELESYLVSPSTSTRGGAYVLEDELSRFDCTRIKYSDKFESIYKNSERTFEALVQCHLTTSKSKIDRMSSEYLVRRLIRDCLLDCGINIPNILGYEGDILHWRDTPQEIEWISCSLILSIGQRVTFKSSSYIYILDTITEAVVGSSLGRLNVDLTFDEVGLFLIGCDEGVKVRVHVVDCTSICPSIPILPQCCRYTGEFLDRLKLWIENDLSLKRVERDILPDNIEVGVRGKLLESKFIHDLKDSEDVSETLSSTRYSSLRGEMLKSLAVRAEESMSGDDLALSSFRTWYQVLQEDSYSILVNSFESSKFSSVKFQHQISLMLRDPRGRKKMKRLLKGRFSS